ncbi:MAG: multicopper oxidase domain-containing protein [Okeania sp. SIO2B9]|nr:multicopper oxidase domain-containing protein [Okeania sp. SIO2B9]
MLKSLLSLDCITSSGAYDEPLTKKRYFYFSSDFTDNFRKFFLKGFNTQAEAHLDEDTNKRIDNNKIKELFDGNRIDKISRVGDIEEWHLVNTDDFAHVFHIHQLDFVVTKFTFPGTLDDVPDTYNNYQVDKAHCQTVPLPYRQNQEVTENDPTIGQECPLLTQGYRDVINLPKHSVTTVRIPFVNPFITGVFVYHCHILIHEDLGMMNNIKVINPKGFNESQMKQLKAVIESFRNKSKS